MVMLTKVDFESVATKYQRTAQYNVDGQGYISVQVAGSNETAVEQFLEELVLDLEITEIQSDRTTEQIDDSEEQGSPTSTEEPIPQEVSDDLEISFKFVPDKNSKPYLGIIFRLDPAINHNVSHRYYFRDASHASLDVSSDRGRVIADMYQGARWIRGKSVGASETAVFSKSVVSGESTYFTVLVTGKMNSSYYRLNGDLTMT
ncbi:hypothetical protein U2F10_21775 [Leptothoe sp. EHU-05/26/07-4]